jgi:hypothetical protein
LTQTSLNVEDSGLLGQNPTNLTVDASGTLYFFDELIGNDDPLQGDVVALPPSGIPQALPIPNTVPYEGVNLPFDPGSPNSMVAAPSGKIYIASGDIYVLNRTQGLLHFPEPNYPFPMAVYNIGNQNLVGSSPDKLFTETGNGAGSFQFGAPLPNFGEPACAPQIMLAPGNTCAIGVTFTPQAPGSVIDILHFPTNSLSSPIFKLIGVSP